MGAEMERGGGFDGLIVLGNRKEMAFGATGPSLYKLLKAKKSKAGG